MKITRKLKIKTFKEENVEQRKQIIGSSKACFSAAQRACDARRCGRGRLGTGVCGKTIICVVEFKKMKSLIIKE